MFQRGCFLFGIGYRELHCRGEPYLIPTTTPVQFEPEPLKGSIRTLLAREPEAMHLTHYGRVGDVARLGADLLEQVDAMVALAWQAHAGAHDDVGRQVLLVDGLTRYYVTRARAHGVAEDELLLGNGSHELLMMLAQAFAGPGRGVVSSVYGFAVYGLAAGHGITHY